MKNKFIYFGWVFLLFTNNFVHASSNIKVSQSAKLEYLKFVSNHVSFLNDANLFLLSNLNTCLKKDHTTLTFKIKTPTLAYNSRIENVFSCDELITKYLPMNQQSHIDKYAKLVRGLMLVRPRFRTDNHILDETIDGDLTLKISPQPKHFSLGSFSRVQIDKSEANLRIQTALSIYNKSIMDNCNSYISRADFSLSSFAVTKDFIFRNDLCQYLVRKNWDNLPKLDFESFFIAKEIQKNFVRWSSSKREQWRETIYSELIKIYRHFPFFSQFTNSKPTTQKIQQVLEHLIKESKKISSYEKQCKKSSNKYSCYLPVFSFVLQSSYFDLIDLPISEDRYSQDSIRASVYLDYQSMKQREAIKNGSIVLGSVAACLFFPYGKLAGLAAKVITRNVCVFNIGFALDAYFIPGHMAKLASARRSLISTIDYNYAVINYKKLSEAKRNFLYSTLFIPLNFLGGAELYRLFVK